MELIILFHLYCNASTGVMRNKIGNQRDLVTTLSGVLLMLSSVGILANHSSAQIEDNNPVSGFPANPSLTPDLNGEMKHKVGNMESERNSIVEEDGNHALAKLQSLGKKAADASLNSMPEGDDSLKQNLPGDDQITPSDTKTPETDRSGTNVNNDEGKNSENTQDDDANTALKGYLHEDREDEDREDEDREDEDREDEDREDED